MVYHHRLGFSIGVKLKLLQIERGKEEKTREKLKNKLLRRGDCRAYSSSSRFVTIGFSPSPLITKHPSLVASDSHTDH